MRFKDIWSVLRGRSRRSSQTSARPKAAITGEDAVRRASLADVYQAIYAALLRAQGGFEPRDAPDKMLKKNGNGPVVTSLGALAIHSGQGSKHRGHRMKSDVILFTSL